MKQSIISSIVLSILLIIFGFFIFHAKQKMENFIVLSDKINNLIIINKDFNIFLEHSTKYNNFDDIQAKVMLFNKNLEIINQQISIKQDLTDKIKTIETTIEKAKSTSAVLNNSFRFIQKLNDDIKSNKYNKLFVGLLTLDDDDTIDIKNILNNFHLYKPLTQEEKLFLEHAKLTLLYHDKFNQLQQKIKEVKLEGSLNKFYNDYKQTAQIDIINAQIMVIILFVLLILFSIIYLYFSHKIIKQQNELKRFKNTVQNSDNIILVTDNHYIIKYVNEAFTKTTGYTPEEVIGKTPKILNSGKQDKDFYDNLAKTINSGNKWTGNFVNKNKNGNYSYEKASISPVFDDNGEIVEFIAIKLNITEDIKLQEKLKSQENMLLQQSKMATMGEMLENIAHQWRQPLSTISTLSTGLSIQKEMGLIIEDEEIIEILYKINNTTQYLSNTIENFRNFFNNNKAKSICNLGLLYKNTLNLVNSKYASQNIEIKENIEEIEINTSENDLVQVIMNILNNASDILNTIKGQRKLILIDIYKKNQNAIISITDNGGGIDINIINKVFEPYFTTKHKSQGTGIGLYMSYNIIKNLGGEISVQNSNYEYDGLDYKGAKFTIILPIENNNQ